VEYYPLFPNPHSSTLTNGFDLAASSVFLQPDGSYSLVVLPGPRVVCVAASPRHRYAVVQVDEKELDALVPDGINHNRGHNPRSAVGAEMQDIVCVNKYHVLSLIDPRPRAELPALDLLVQSARTLQGTVVGPDGEPLPGAKVIGLTALPEAESLNSASFWVTGLNPQRPRDLFFHHRDKALGKLLTIHGNEPEPLTVQLEPCGTVSGRQELDERMKVVLRRLEGRSQMVDKVLASRVTLLEAAARYRDLFASSPEARDTLRRQHPGIDYEEALCRRVILDVEAALDCGATNQVGGLVARLESALREHLQRHGKVRLP
jgi:hypothetical protein